jgi:hypothetical protein
VVQQAALVLALLQVQVELAPRRERVQEQVLVLRQEQVRAVQELALLLGRRLLHRRLQ